MPKKISEKTRQRNANLATFAEHEANKLRLKRGEEIPKQSRSNLLYLKKDLQVTDYPYPKQLPHNRPIPTEKQLAALAKGRETRQRNLEAKRIAMEQQQQQNNIFSYKALQAKKQAHLNNIIYNIKNPEDARKVQQYIQQQNLENMPRPSTDIYGNPI